MYLFKRQSSAARLLWVGAQTLVSGESIVIGDNIYITFVESDKSGYKFRLAIDAPKDVKIVRGKRSVPLC